MAPFPCAKMLRVRSTPYSLGNGDWAGSVAEARSVISRADALVVGIGEVIGARAVVETAPPRARMPKASAHARMHSAVQTCGRSRLIMTSLPFAEGARRGLVSARRPYPVS